MNDEEVYASLPDDPEEAFLLLEAHFRQIYDNQLAFENPNDPAEVLRLRYLSRVFAAIRELGLESEAFSEKVPSVRDLDQYTYAKYVTEIDHYRTGLQIRRGKRIQGYSVRFDGATKEKLRHHLEQIRALVDKAELNEGKKEALFKKINALQGEIDRDRTRFEALAALTIEAAGTLGQAIERSKIENVLDKIAHIFWGAKQEETKRLPPPTERKRIEPPPTTPSREDTDKPTGG